MQKRILKVGLEIKNKKVSLEVKKLSLIGKFVGLMFSRRQKAKALLFDFAKPIRIPIHSWFVFFPFYAVWLDNKNKIIEIKKIPSWKCLIKPKQKFTKLVEIPINDKYKQISRVLDGKRKV